MSLAGSRAPHAVQRGLGRSSSKSPLNATPFSRLRTCSEESLSAGRVSFGGLIVRVGSRLAHWPEGDTDAGSCFVQNQPRLNIQLGGN